MAKIYPPIPNENSDEYELEVRNHLSKLPDSWQILHRQRVRFILISSERMGLEVKGGAISRMNLAGYNQRKGLMIR